MKFHIFDSSFVELRSGLKDDPKKRNDKTATQLEIKNCYYMYYYSDCTCNLEMSRLRKHLYQSAEFMFRIRVGKEQQNVHRQQTPIQ